MTYNRRVELTCEANKVHQGTIIVYRYESIPLVGNIGIEQLMRTNFLAGASRTIAGADPEGADGTRAPKLVENFFYHYIYCSPLRQAHYCVFFVWLSRCNESY